MLAFFSMLCSVKVVLGSLFLIYTISFIKNLKLQSLKTISLYEFNQVLFTMIVESLLSRFREQNVPFIVSSGWLHLESTTPFCMILFES